MLSTTLNDEESLDEAEIISAIYLRNERLIFKTIWSYTTDPLQVEEIMQTVLVKLVDKVSKLATMDERAQSTYVVKIAKSKAVNYLRRLKIEDDLFSREDFDIETRTIPDSGPSPEEIILQKEYLEEHYRALSKLPALEKELLYGKHFLELSDQELADIAGCGVGCVRMKLTRARFHARKLLKEGGYVDEEA